MPPPVPTRWTGDAFVPLNRYWRQHACKHYKTDEEYVLAPYEARSIRSHNHYFVCVEEAWKNLPEELCDRFPTAEHLRKYALIKAGYRDERSIVCASKAEAQRVAAFIRPMDDYAIVVCRDATVIVYTARSQSTKAMGKKVFQESKDAVLRVLTEMVGVGVDTLKMNAGRSA